MARCRKPPIPTTHPPDDLAAIGIDRRANRIFTSSEVRGPQPLVNQKTSVKNIYREDRWRLGGRAMGRKLLAWFGGAIGWRPQQESAPKPEPQSKEHVAAQKTTPKKKPSAPAQREFDFL